MILDIQKSYPETFETDFDLQKFTKGKNFYEVDRKFDLESDQLSNFKDRFYALRRKGFLKTVVRPTNK